jgi:hypothetical protein
LSWQVDAVDQCPADLDGSGEVNVDDLLMVIGVYGTNDPSGDANGDGVVDTNDVLAVLAAWGSCD